MAGHVVHERDRTLGREGLGVGADTVAGCAGCGVGGAEEERRVTRLGAVTLLAIATGFASAGCATTLRSIPEDIEPTGQAVSIVIGRVEFLKTSGDPLWLTTFFLAATARDIAVSVTQEVTGRRYILKGVEPGAMVDFYVALPPGRYRITRVAQGDFHSNFKNTVFNVPRAPIVYIGTLRFVGERTSFAEHFGSLAIAKGRWSVVDAPDDVVQRFRRRYPRLNDPIVPSLIGPPSVTGEAGASIRGASDGIATGRLPDTVDPRGPKAKLR